MNPSKQKEQRYEILKRFLKISNSKDIDVNCKLWNPKKFP